MKSLSGWIYLIVGSTVVIISYYTNKDKLLFFILVGIIMIAIGLIKIFFEIFMKKNLEKKHHKHVHSQTTKTNLEVNYKICPNCGVKVHKSFKFCPNCGYRLI